MASPLKNLFDVAQNSILDWLPEETLFSQCSRQHAFWGHAKARSTSTILFGPRGSSLHDLPGHLDTFSERTSEVLGTSSAVAESRTLLRFYRPFLTVGEFENAIAAMRSSSVAHLKFTLGLLTSRFRANHPLKACNECIIEDSKTYGWSYWHLEQQYPGVWVCLKHNSHLRECIVKSTGVGRFTWVLPSPNQLTVEPSIPHETYKQRHLLAKLIVELVNNDQPTGWLKFSLIRPAILSVLKAQGLITADGNLRLKPMAKSFLHYCRDFTDVSELASLPVTIEAAQVQLGRLLRPKRTGTHALSVLTFANWLFEDAHQFYLAIEREKDKAPLSLSPPTIDISESREADDRKRRVIQRIGSGQAVSAVAKQVGIDIATAKAWAAQAGVSTPRRASILKKPVLQLLIRDLCAGMDKECAAQTHHVSVSSINRVLRTEVGIHEAWNEARETTAREAARNTWRILKNNHGHLGTKFLRKSEPSVYAWLYRNDLKWLQGNTPKRLSTIKTAKSPRVDWDNRDIAFKNLVQAAVLQLSESNSGSGKRLRLWQIYQVVPELKPLLSRLDRMPLTKKIIEFALARNNVPRTPTKLTHLILE